MKCYLKERNSTILALLNVNCVNVLEEADEEVGNKPIRNQSEKKYATNTLLRTVFSKPPLIPICKVRN